MIVVELDGGQHEDQRAQDAARAQWLGEQGFHVLRFSGREALMQTEAVLTEIQNRQEPHPNPPPKHGGGSCFSAPQRQNYRAGRSPKT